MITETIKVQMHNIYNKNHTAITRVETVKTKHVAPEKCNKDGIIEGYFYSDNWENTREFPPVRYAAFGTSKNDIEILPSDLTGKISPCAPF